MHVQMQSEAWLNWKGEERVDSRVSVESVVCPNDVARWHQGHMR